MDASPRLRPATLLLLLLLVPAMGQAQAPRGVAFDDTLFAAVDAAWRVAFDEDGGVWYTSEGGLVHVDPVSGVRELFTSVEGLPSSYSMGLAVGGGKAYVATDGGIGVVTLATGEVRAVTRDDSPLRAMSVEDVALDGNVLWVGTRTAGVARWDLATDEWTFHNTSARPEFPLPVRRVVPTPERVWVATEGDGLWRWDRANGTWTHLRTRDGLASMHVLSVLEHDGAAFIGTNEGLQRLDLATGDWRRFGLDDGLPSERVLDLDLIPNEEDLPDLWASTPRGLWQHDLRTGESGARNVGLFGSYVLSNEWNATHGWLVATERGVHHFRDGGWLRYPTNAAAGAGSGPFTSRITTVGGGEGGPYVWFGSHQGLLAYRRPTADRPGAWFNLGPSQHYPGTLVNAIDTEGNTTWMATNTGVFGYNRESNAWLSRAVNGTRNLVYGVEVDRGELWIPFFGEGLLAQDLATGRTRTWNYGTPISIPDINLLDLRIQGDDVWIGSARGLLRLDRVTGTVKEFHTQADGIPGGTVFRVLPDGPVVWLGTKNGGVARWDVAQARVTDVWNGTTTEGFLWQDVRALHRQGNNLWAGTVGGLWRLDLATGRDRVYNASNSGLVQDFVQGIGDADGILYLATFSGVARMDLATGEFLPMRDGPGVVRGTPPATAEEDPFRVASVSVRIASPRDGAFVAGPVAIQGTAYRFGGSVDAVEVRVGDGPWRRASGAESWSLAWDASTAEPEKPVVIEARALSGNLTSHVARATVTPVETPTVPLAIEDVTRDRGDAGRGFEVRARIQGDPPLGATLHHKMEDDVLWRRTEMTLLNGFWFAQVPADQLAEGTLLYFIEARSGPLTLTSPADPESPARASIAPAPRSAFTVRGPASLRADAGQTALVPLVVENVGTTPVSFHLRASGLRASWVRIDAPDHTLAPGENVTVDALLVVPREAFSDATTLTFEASDLVRTERASVPLEVVGAPDDGTPAGKPQGSRIPGPAPVHVLLALVLAVLAFRRRVA